jgi:hypothetical protein
MAVFRGIALHLWSANGLTAGWHDGHQGPYRSLHDEAGHTGTRHALPEPFRIRYRTIGMGRGQPVAQLPTPPGAEVMW